MADDPWVRVNNAVDGCYNRGGFWVDVADGAREDLTWLRRKHEAACLVAETARAAGKCHCNLPTCEALEVFFEALATYDAVKGEDGR